MKKRENKNAIIAFLVVMLLTLSIYILYDDGYLFNSRTTNLDVNDSEVVDLFKSISGNCITDYYYQDNGKSNKDIPNELMYQLAISKINSYGIKDSIKSSEIDEFINKYFGKYNFKHTDYSSCPVYEYDSSTSTYKHTGEICNSACDSSPIVKIIKATKSNKELILEVKVLFSDGEHYYEDYEHTVEAVEDENRQVGTFYRMVFGKDKDNYVYKYTVIRG